MLEVLSAVADVIGRPVPSVDGPRRAGDMAELVADVSRIRDELSWSSSRSLHEMVEDAWRWRTANPDGYRK